MENEEGDVKWWMTPGALDLPPWAFAQVGQLYETVARAEPELGGGVVEGTVALPKVIEIPGENLDTPGVIPDVLPDVPFIRNIPEVNVPWAQPNRWIRQFVKPVSIAPSQGLAGGLARVMQIAAQWQRMLGIDAVSSQPLEVPSSTPLGLERVGETLYAEALAQVRDSWNQDDVAAADVGNKPDWYWAGLAAATVALFTRAFQDSSGRVIQAADRFRGRGPGTGRQSGGSGGGGGTLVNTAEILRRQLAGSSRRRRPRINEGVTTPDDKVIEIEDEGAFKESGNIHIL